MSIRHTSIPILTDGAGAATVYTTEIVDGELSAIRLLLGTLASGAVDFTITDTATGLALLTVSNLAANTDYYPRGAAVNPANTAITNSFVMLPITGSVKVVVAAGGATTTGTVHVWWKD